MARPSKYDWNKIRKWYEAGHTQKEILDEFNCPKSSLSERVKKEKWVINELTEPFVKGVIEVSELKANFNEQNQEVCELAEDRAKRLLKQRGMVFDVGDLLAKAKFDMLTKGKVNKPIKVKNGDYETVEQIEHDLTASDLSTLANGLDKLSVTLGVNERFNQSANVQIANQNNQETILEIK